MPNDTGPLRIRLSDNRRGALKRDLSAYFEAQFGDPMSDFRADELVGFFMKHLGPQVYNQAIADARGFMLETIEDLEVEVYEPEGEKR